jgi:predicted O-methyltransferase YrrM
MKLFFDTLQRIKYRLGFDRKNFILRHIKNNKCTSILEIGVFNGNFAERLLKTACKSSPDYKINYLGIDLFKEGLTEAKHAAEVSLYPNTLAEVESRLSKVKNTEVKLIQGDSTLVLPQIAKHLKFDLIHIDGGHSFETVQRDWENVMELIDSSTVIFFDDYTNHRGITKGGFGVNKVVDRIDSSKFQVKVSKNRDYFWKAYGLLCLKVAMVTNKSKNN